jgi:phosphocarrier protein
MTSASVPGAGEPGSGDARSLEVTVCNSKGLHARAAAMFVKKAEEFDARVEVTRDGETVSGSSIMDLLLLAAGKGTQLVISTVGHDAAPALAALKELVEAGFHERD